MRALCLTLAAGLLLAGCAGTPTLGDLESKYGAGNVSAVAVPGTLLGGSSDNVTLNFIAGTHLGLESGVTNVTVEAGSIKGPKMANPSPMGGGGDVQPLNPPAPTSFAVRLLDPPTTTGLTVAWFVVAEGDAGLTLPAPAARTAATETFSATIDHPGTVRVTAMLLASRDAPIDQPLAIFEEKLSLTVLWHYTGSGEVQPVSPGGIGLPAATPTATPRAQMVDAYTFQAPAGVPARASTKFAGTPTSGTDVDLGLYGPDGQGLACAADGSPTSPAPLAPDPGQANERLQTATNADGLWSLQVGAMADGCGGIQGSTYYNNAGPVPYTFDLVLG